MKHPSQHPTQAGDVDPLSPAAMTEVPRDLQVGDKVGDKYTLLRLLGRGGMGAVFEAENTWTTRHVAIKVLRPGLAADLDAIQRFKREARMATQLAHPNIVDVLDLGRDARTGSLYLVQELLDGSDLHKRLEEKGRLTPREALDVMVPVMGALAAAHARGVIHRDIKPENIVLARGAGEGVTPKLIDFGLARAIVEGEGLRMTATGAVMGTPYYMPPEQVRGEKDLDGRADVWAVGAVLFELLTGRTPFEADNYNLLMFKILAEPPPRLTDVAPDVPASLASIIEGALQPDREKRFPTMKAFLDALFDANVLDDPPERSLQARHRESIRARPVVTPATPDEVDLGVAPTASLQAQPARAGEPAFSTPKEREEAATPSPPTVRPAVISEVKPRLIAISTQPGSRTETLIGITALTVLLSIAVGALLSRTPAPDRVAPSTVLPLTASPAAPQASPRPVEPSLAPPAAPGPRGVRVAIRVEPEDSELRLDDNRLVLPYDGEVPSGTHSIEVRRDGYRTLLLDRVSILDPQTINLRLQRAQGRHRGTVRGRLVTDDAGVARVEPVVGIATAPVLVTPPPAPPVAPASQPAHAAPATPRDTRADESGRTAIGEQL